MAAIPSAFQETQQAVMRIHEEKNTMNLGPSGVTGLTSTSLPAENDEKSGGPTTPTTESSGGSSLRQSKPDVKGLEASSQATVAPPLPPALQAVQGIHGLSTSGGMPVNLPYSASIDQPGNPSTSLPQAAFPQQSRAAQQGFSVQGGGGPFTTHSLIPPPSEGIQFYPGTTSPAYSCSFSPSMLSFLAPQTNMNDLVVVFNDKNEMGQASLGTSPPGTPVVEDGSVVYPAHRTGFIFPHQNLTDVAVLSQWANNAASMATGNNNNAPLRSDDSFEDSHFGSGVSKFGDVAEPPGGGYTFSEFVDSRGVPVSPLLLGKLFGPGSPIAHIATPQAVGPNGSPIHPGAAFAISSPLMANWDVTGGQSFLVRPSSPAFSPSFAPSISGSGAVNSAATNGSHVVGSSTASSSAQLFGGNNVNESKRLQAPLDSSNSNFFDILGTKLNDSRQEQQTRPAGDQARRSSLYVMPRVDTRNGGGSTAGDTAGSNINPRPHGSRLETRRYTDSDSMVKGHSLNSNVVSDDINPPPKMHDSSQMSYDSDDLLPHRLLQFALHCLQEQSNCTSDSPETNAKLIQLLENSLILLGKDPADAASQNIDPAILIGGTNGNKLVHPDEFKNPSTFLKIYGDPLCFSNQGPLPRRGKGGNWECIKCRNVNFPRRFRCNKCATARGEQGDRIVSEYVKQVYDRYLSLMKPGTGSTGGGTNNSSSFRPASSGNNGQYNNNNSRRSEPVQSSTLGTYSEAVGPPSYYVSNRDAPANDWKQHSQQQGPAQQGSSSSGTTGQWARGTVPRNSNNKGSNNMMGNNNQRLFQNNQQQQRMGDASVQLHQPHHQQQQHPRIVQDCQESATVESNNNSSKMYNLDAENNKAREATSSGQQQQFSEMPPPAVNGTTHPQWEYLLDAKQSKEFFPRPTVSKGGSSSMVEVAVNHHHHSKGSYQQHNHNKSTYPGSKSAKRTAFSSTDTYGSVGSDFDISDRYGPPINNSDKIALCTEH